MLHNQRVASLSGLPSESLTPGMEDYKKETTKGSGSLGGEKTGDRKNKLIKFGLLSLLVGIIIYVVLDYTLPSLGHVNRILTSFLLWVEEHPGEGVVAFASVYVLTTVLFIPGSILTLGAGLVFGRALGTGLGVLLGSISVFIGASIGATIAFLLGRYVLQDSAQKLFNKFSVLKAVDKAIENEGLRLVILLRLSPVIPFSAFNYVMGLTRVMFRQYVLGCVGMLPGTVAYVFIGTSAAGLLGDADDGSQESEDGASGGDGGGSGDDGRLVNIVVLVVGAA
eukprot:CAMPEP_0194584160 /NCGR_PEP_ID=MMETSP0292-20121207/16854_1 /TAXON_ID=39354 /ORGANISM="Heterosigma akashiwo, Strain CCMP2393" /LENGTH=280 /DNA_ID=CAMNT_0039439089 /DNA_START=21 /DNA_END=859 /DNA_ORIENTATION=+